jgi:hypothetical protein
LSVFARSTRPAIDIHLHATEQLQIESGRRDDQIRCELLARAQRDALRVNVSI